MHACAQPHGAVLNHTTLLFPAFAACRNMVQLLGAGCFNMGDRKDIRQSLYIVEEFGGSWSVFKMLRSKKLHRTHPHVQFTPADCMR
jgi:hypothetical protein